MAVEGELFGAVVQRHARLRADRTAKRKSGLQVLGLLYKTKK
jgi:hypothetical protein